MNDTDKALRDLWDGQPCYLRIPGVCQGTANAPCHSNESAHGKGKSIKAHDVFTVPGCNACHHELDQGKRLTREERVHYWREAFFRWVLFLFQTGKVVVAGQEPVVHGSYTPIPKVVPRRV